MQRRRAIIFDLDGTLTDSAPALTRALNVVWGDHGRPSVSLAAVKSYIGDGPERLIARARAALGLAGDVAAVGRETAAFLAAYAAGGPGGEVYPGAIPVLERLAGAGLRLAVCTNKPQAAAEKLLAELGLARWLDGVVGGDAATRQKPDPAHVRAVLALMSGVDAAQAVLVGDGPQDVAAAEAAGVAVIVAAYGYGGAAGLRPDLPAIADIRDLPALLATPSGVSAGAASFDAPN